MADNQPMEHKVEPAPAGGLASTLLWEWPGLVVGLALFGFFASVLFGQDTLFYRDLYRHYMPIGQLLAPSAGSAVSLLWDPYLNGGQPWLANPNCFALYPSRVLYFVLTPLAAFNWEIFLHHFLGTLGTYLLARRLRLSPAGAATAAAVWAFAGVSVSMVHLGRFLSYHTLPFAALAAVGISRHRHRGRWFAMLTAAFFLQLLSGAVELIPVSLLLAMTMVTGLQPGFRQWSRSLLSIATSLVLAIGLAAIQIVPAIHFLKFTARAASGIGAGILDWSLSPLRVVEILVPGAFGPLDVANPESAYWGSQIVDQGIPLLVSVYGGAAAILLAVAALIAPTGDEVWRRLRWFLLAAIVVSGVVASAASLPFAQSLFDAAPWLAAVRYPVKLLTLFVLPFALLAGWGAHRLTFEGGLFAKITAVLAAVATAGVAIFSMVARVFPGAAEGALEWYFHNRTPGTLEGVTAGLDHSGLALIGVLLTAGLIIRGIRSTGRTLLVILVAADLAAAASAFWLTGPKAAFGRMPPIAAAVRSQLHQGVLFRDANPIEVVPPLPANRAWAPAAWWFSVVDDHQATTWSIPTIFHPNTSSLVSERVERLRLRVLSLEWSRRLGVLNAAGATVILTFDEIADPRLQLVDEYPVSGDVILRLYRNDSALAGFWFAREFVVVADGDEALASLLSGRFDPHQTVILERSSPSGPSTGQRLAAMVGLDQTLFEEEVDLQEDAHIVFTLPWHQEMVAYVDTTQSVFERANFAFSAIEVPEGRHRVRVAYRPGSVFWGGLISLASAMGWAAFAFLRRRSNRRPNAQRSDESSRANSPRSA